MMQPTEYVLILVVSTNHEVAEASLAKYCHPWVKCDLRKERLSSPPHAVRFVAYSRSCIPNIQDRNVARHQNARTSYISCCSSSQALIQQVARSGLSCSSIAQPRGTTLTARSCYARLLAHSSLVPELLLSRSLCRLRWGRLHT